MKNSLNKQILFRKKNLKIKIYIEINLTERQPNLSIRIPIKKAGKSKNAIPNVIAFFEINEKENLFF
jgi:hypothetical protein